VLAADLDADGDQDVYVANDSNPNFVFRNEGGGRFTEMGVVSGAAFDDEGAAQAGMGVTTLDFDRDGVLDIFVTNFADDASTLYRGEGNLFFSDVSKDAGVAGPTYLPLSWGVAGLDFDQDADDDLVVANGHIYPQVDAIPSALPYRQHALVLENRDGTFVDATREAGPGWEVAGSFRGLATGDANDDGIPDLLLTRVDEPPLLLLGEGGDASRRLVVRPSRPLPRWIGARIEVTAGGRTQSRVVLSGGSYASQSSLAVAFALGEATEAARVVVRFPGGGVFERRDVPGGTELTVDVPR